MDMNERLPCGADMDALVEQVADGDERLRSPHQEICVHCQTALEELARAWAPVSALAGSEAALPERVVHRIMRRIWRAAAAGWHTVAVTARGKTTISDWVVGLISEGAAREVEAVHLIGGSLARVAQALRSRRPGSPPPPHSPRGLAAEIGPQQATVEIALTAVYGPGLLDVAEAVRRTVAERVEQMTGLEVVEVDVTVVDLHVER
jgi:uncharacterized alkaline shock family protein YloU